MAMIVHDSSGQINNENESDQMFSCVLPTFFPTAMLVLTTMFINVSNNLPKTSYVKMIDVWLIFNLLLPFIEVLVHTYMDALR